MPPAPRSVAPFFVSCFLAFVAGHTVNYSVIIYAQEVLGSDLLSGVGFGLCFGPPIVLGWYAGVLCDRMAPRTIILLAQAAFMAAGLLLWMGEAFVTASEGRTAVVLVSAFLAGCAWSFIAPARLAALARIVPAENLHRAMVLLNLLIMMGFGVAPIVIALVHGAFGWGGVFLVVIAGFFLASVALGPVPSALSGRRRRHALAEIREGIAAVAARPILAQLLLTAVLVYTLMGPMQVLLPRLASARLMLSGLERGAYLGTLALALIIGGVLCMVLRTRLHDGRAILFGSLIAGAAVLALARITDPLASAGVLLASGIVGGMVVSLVVAGLQTETAAHVRGRVMSMYTIVSQIVPAASGFLAGALSEYLGLVASLTICGALIVTGAALALGRLGALRAYRHSATGATP